MFTALNISLESVVLNLAQTIMEQRLFCLTDLFGHLHLGNCLAFVLLREPICHLLVAQEGRLQQVPMQPSTNEVPLVNSIRVLLEYV